jgi:RecB family exonuclease
VQAEAKRFDSYGIEVLEQHVEQIYDTFFLKGDIDRVSIDEEGDPVIFDYKTKGTPKISACTANENGEISDFQMAVYIKMYEKIQNKKISYAAFASLIDREYTVIIDNASKKTREAYDETMYVLEEYINMYCAKVLAFDLSTKNVPFSTCISCEYKTICRKTYQWKHSLITEGSQNE